eukprot:7391605-Prymnesium_polylepis.4
MAQQPSAHSNHVQSVSFSPDGKLVVSSSSDKSIKLWDGRPHSKGENCGLLTRRIKDRVRRRRQEHQNMGWVAALVWRGCARLSGAAVAWWWSTAQA